MKKKYLIYLFLFSIIAPTTFLSYLSFKSIEQEVFLIRNQEAHKIQQTGNKFKTFLEAFADSVYLSYTKLAIELSDQNESSFYQPLTLKKHNVPEYLSLNLFYGKNLIYPKSNILIQRELTSSVTDADQLESNWLYLPNHPSLQRDFLKKRQAKISDPSLTIEQKLANLLGIIKIYYKLKDYEKVIVYCNRILTQPNIDGILSKNLTAWIWLTKFNSFYRLGKYPQAVAFAKGILAEKLPKANNIYFNQSLYFLEEVLNNILSLEDLSHADRNFFWNSRKNWYRLLSHHREYHRYKHTIKDLLNWPSIKNSGINILQQDSTTFIHISKPYTRNPQQVVAVTKTRTFNKHFIRNLKKRFPRDQYFEIVKDNRVLFKSHLEFPTNETIQITLNEKFPNWEINLYKVSDENRIRRAERKKILLYGLLGTALSLIIIGFIVFYYGLVQERRILNLKANFVSSVSHELKTPLTSIKMFAEMIQNGRVKQMEKAQEYSQHITNESNRLQNLIEDILQFNRLEQAPELLTKEKLNLSDMIHKVVQSFSNQLNLKAISIDSDIEEDCFINGNEKSIFSLIQNLFDNAIKYNNENGKVFLNLKTESGKLHFSIQDTGIGIPVGEQEKIFNVFYRVGDELTRRVKGSGLGLAIVKRIVDMHNAKISVKSKPNVGTTFNIIFDKA